MLNHNYFYVYSKLNPPTYLLTPATITVFTQDSLRAIGIFNIEASIYMSNTAAL